MAAAPFKVKAVYEYSSPHEDDLDFANGTIITVTEEEGDDWYVGEYTDDNGVKHDGLFPRNFVKKYEPAAPPRPTRTRTKKETAPPLTAAPLPTDSVPDPEPQPVEPELPISETVEALKSQPLTTQPPREAISSKAVPKPESPKPQPPTKKNLPPPVSEKPSSFKDRIAAFNKPSAAPLAPIKPGAPGPSSSNSFIKKPFVAPPPARNAYVPSPREPAPVQKTYRREEDPEILERQKQDEEAAERAGLASGEPGEDAEEGAKSTSLKDRIAALQRQQQDQAARRAEAGQKEKPKRPTKKRTESGDEIVATPIQDESPVIHDTGVADAMPMRSMESAREVPRPPLATARRPSRQALESPSDGNEADQSGAGETTEDGDASSTEVEDVDDRPHFVPQAPARTSTTLSREIEAEPENIAETDEEPPIGNGEAGETESEVDEETRRKEELRARMAKMSGGMGMPGMFSMPSGEAAPRKRTSGTREDRPKVESDQPASPPPLPAHRMPMVPVSGLPHRTATEPRSLEVSKEPETGVPLSSLRDPEEVPDVEDLGQTSPPARPSERAAPPLPQDRPLPPPPPSQPKGAPSVPSNRPVPPPAPRDAQPTAPRAMTDDDLAIDTAPPPHPVGPRSPPGNRISQILEPTSPTSPSDKRVSRAIPPVPTMPPAPPTGESRPPPPPPPTAAPLSRRSTENETLAEEEEEERDSEYEGDYDTDIASGATHRNALNKLQEREPSMDGSTLSEETRPPVVGPPPVPIHRGAPPPPPHQAPPTRPSTDAPRAPPPIPPQISHRRDDSYDPYRYTGPSHGMHSSSNKTAGEALQQESDPALYGDIPVRSGPAPALGSPPDRSTPYMSGALPRESREAPRQSTELPRPSMSASRKSVDQSRPGMDHGSIAQDIDLGQKSMWWTQAQALPPVFQGRSDILCDFDEQTTSRRGGRTTISRDVYVLFQDYSQTIITARFDPKDPSDVNIEQRHEPPVARSRQDQLEAAHNKLGPSIVEGASKRSNHTVGDGSPQALIVDILQTIPNALLPVGTRSYGALVYTNMANATVQQFDEIRPGDIITFRNAKFQGKHGPVHAKYSEDVGKPEHVGIVSEWDGTKKKIRAFEQGREVAKAKGKTKVELQSSRLADLRSGEVKVWRVMEKSWVGWDQ